MIFVKEKRIGFIKVELQEAMNFITRFRLMRLMKKYVICVKIKYCNQKINYCH